jgi:hypothetical protein
MADIPPSRAIHPCVGLPEVAAIQLPFAAAAESIELSSFFAAQFECKSKLQNGGAGRDSALAQRDSDQVACLRENAGRLLVAGAVRKRLLLLH